VAFRFVISISQPNSELTTTVENLRHSKIEPKVIISAVAGCLERGIVVDDHFVDMGLSFEMVELTLLRGST
jgi:hypothetical protein